MESSSERDMREVPGSGFSVGAIPLHSNAITLLSGFIVGLTTANAILTILRHPHIIIAALVGVSIAISTTLLFVDWRTIRKQRKQLMEYRDELLRTARADLTERFPDDPVFVAGAMLKLQEDMSKT